MSKDQTTGKRRRNMLCLWAGLIIAGPTVGVMLAAFIGALLWERGYRDALSQYAPLVGCVILGLVVSIDMAVQETRKQSR